MLESEVPKSADGRTLATLGQRRTAKFADGACGCLSFVLGIWLGGGLFLGLADSAVGHPGMGYLAVGLLLGLPLAGVLLPILLYSLGFSVGRPIIGISQVYRDGSRVPTLRSRRRREGIYLVSKRPRSGPGP